MSQSTWQLYGQLKQTGSELAQFRCVLDWISDCASDCSSRTISVCPSKRLFGCLREWGNSSLELSDCRSSAEMAEMTETDYEDIIWTVWRNCRSEQGSSRSFLSTLRSSMAQSRLKMIMKRMQTMLHIASKYIDRRDPPKFMQKSLQTPLRISRTTPQFWPEESWLRLNPANPLATSRSSGYLTAMQLTMYLVVLLSSAVRLQMESMRLPKMHLRDSKYLRNQLIGMAKAALDWGHLLLQAPQSWYRELVLMAVGELEVQSVSRQHIEGWLSQLEVLLRKVMDWGLMIPTQEAEQLLGPQTQWCLQQPSFWKLLLVIALMASSQASMKDMLPLMPSWQGVRVSLMLCRTSEQQPTLCTLQAVVRFSRISMSPAKTSVICPVLVISPKSAL